MFFIIGLILIPLGIFITIYSDKILESFGRVDFFERHLASEGGSRLGYKLLGLLFIFIGLLCITGMIDGFLKFLLWPLLRLQPGYTE